MKAHQVYNFSTGFKFPQNFLLMNYKLNKTHNHTWKSNADLSRINSWGHKLYINTLLYDYTFLSNNLTRRRGMKIGIVGVPLTSALLNLPKGKSLGRSKPATNS